MTTSTLRYCTCAVAFALIASSAFAQAKPTGGLEEVLAAWQKREDAVPNARVRIAETRTVPKGAFADTPNDDEKGSPPPPEDFTGEQSYELLILGDSLRSKHKYWSWSTSDHKFVSTEENVRNRDGTRTSLIPSIFKAIDHPQAVIELEKVSQLFGYTALQPILFSLHPRSVYSLYADRGTTFERLDDRKVGSRSCAVVVDEAHRLTYFLDKERDFLPIRIANGPPEATWNVDIELTRHESGLWVADKWSYTHLFAKDRPFEKCALRVESLDLKTPVSPKDLDLPLPPGTLVFDRTSGADMKYVVTDDGRPGVKVPDSPTMTYRQLLEANRQQKGPMRLGLWVGLVLAVGLGAWIAVRTAKRRRCGA